MKLKESCPQPNRPPPCRAAAQRRRLPSPSPRLRVSSNHRPSTLNSQPIYSIRKHLSFWAVDFDGQTAVFDHEQGAYYVAYLLLNPPAEPIHGQALEVKSLAYFGEFLKCPCMTEIVNPNTGETMTLAY